MRSLIVKQKMFMSQDNGKLKAEALKVGDNMVIYGHVPFVHMLGKLILCADIENIKTIKRSFSNYWNRYKKYE